MRRARLYLVGISEPPSPNRRGETYWSDDKPSICEDLHFINALFGKFCEKRPNLRQQWNKKGMSARRAGIPERVVKLANHWGGGPSDPTEWPAREPFLENAAGAGSEVAQERAARCHPWQSANLLTHGAVAFFSLGANEIPSFIRTEMRSSATARLLYGEWTTNMARPFLPKEMPFFRLKISSFGPFSRKRKRPFSAANWSSKYRGRRAVRANVRAKQFAVFQPFGLPPLGRT